MKRALAACALLSFACSTGPTTTPLVDGAAPADVVTNDATTIDAAPDAEASAPDVSPTAPEPVGPTGTFKLVFDDEFDDTADMSGPTHSLQASKWNSGWYTLGVTATSPPVQSTEAEWYGPEGIVFPGDGAVHLRLFKNASSTYGKTYESGCITTAQHFGFSASKTRTILEARIRVAGPNAQAGGYWPAYWLLSEQDGPGGTGTWPPEIDVFEFFGNANAPVAHLHTTGGDINQGFADSSGASDLSLAFHVYTMDLSASALVFYLDGIQQWSETQSTIIARLLDADPMYVLLDFQFGGAAGSPTGTVPNDMVIDYFRAWQ